MGRGSEKTWTNRILGLLRRAWSFRQLRFSLLALFILTTFIWLFYVSTSNSKTKYLSIYSPPIQAKHSQPIQHKIACLIMGDAYFDELAEDPGKHHNNVENLFLTLKTYERFLSPYCDLKLFLVNHSAADFEYQYMVYKDHFLHSDVTFLPPSNEQLYRKRRSNVYHILAYTWKYYADYEWYLKLHHVDVLVLADHFQKLVYDADGNARFDMSQPQLLGHVLEDECSDYVFGASVYAFNQAFLLKVGQIAVQHIVNDAQRVENVHNCRTYDVCRHHPHDDFAGFCLRDLGIQVVPTRDEAQREYFLPFTIWEHYVHMNEWKDMEQDRMTGWYWKGKSKQAVAENCCATYPVSFGDYGDMKELYLGYRRIYAVSEEQRNMQFLATVMEFDDSPPELPPNVTILSRINDMAKPQTGSD